MDIIGLVGVAAGSVAIPLSAVSTATSVAAISQGASAQSAGGQGAGDAKDDPRLAKFSLRASCAAVGTGGNELHGKIIVLRNRKARRAMLPLSRHY